MSSTHKPLQNKFIKKDEHGVYLTDGNAGNPFKKHKRGQRIMKPPRHELHWLARQKIKMARAMARNILENKGLCDVEKLKQEFPILQYGIFFWCCSFCDVFMIELDKKQADENMSDIKCDLCPLHCKVKSTSGICHPHKCCHSLFEKWLFSTKRRRIKNAQNLHDFIYGIKIRGVVESLGKVDEDRVWKLLLKYGRAM